MRALIRKFNYRMIPLTDPPSSTETVGVWWCSGPVRQLPWKGFVSQRQAVASGAIPVYLDIVAIVPDDRIGTPRIELKDNEAVQGALLDGEIYGVTDIKGCPRIITRFGN